MASIHALLQILKVGPVLHKKYEGREYDVQECECVLLDEDGQLESVGVLRLSEEFRKAPPERGTYQAVFALVASPKDRRIGAQITGLTLVPPSSLVRGSNAASAAAKV